MAFKGGAEKKMFASSAALSTAGDGPGGRVVSSTLCFSQMIENECCLF